MNLSSSGWDIGPPQINQMDLQGNGNALIISNGNYGIYSPPQALDDSPGAITFVINSIGLIDENGTTTQRPYPKHGDMQKKPLWGSPLKLLCFLAFLACILINIKSWYKNAVNMIRKWCTPSEEIDDYGFPIELTGGFRRQARREVTSEEHQFEDVVLNIDEPGNFAMIPRETPRSFEAASRSNSWPVCARTFLQRLQDPEDEPLSYII